MVNIYVISESDSSPGLVFHYRCLVILYVCINLYKKSDHKHVLKESWEIHKTIKGSIIFSLPLTLNKTIYCSSKNQSLSWYAVLVFPWSTSNWIFTVPGCMQVSFLHRDALPQSHALLSELKVSFISRLLCTQWSIFNHSPLFLSLTHRDSFIYAHSQWLKKPIAEHRVPKGSDSNRMDVDISLGKLHSKNSALWERLHIDTLLALCALEPEHPR